MGSTLAKFRRGLHNRIWQTLWHFNEECRDYPVKTFIVAEYPLPNEDLCPDCLVLDKGGRPELE